MSQVDSIAAAEAAEAALAVTAAGIKAHIERPVQTTWCPAHFVGPFWTLPSHPCCCRSAFAVSAFSGIMTRKSDHVSMHSNPNEKAHILQRT